MEYANFSLNNFIGISLNYCRLILLSDHLVVGRKILRSRILPNSENLGMNGFNSIPPVFFRLFLLFTDEINYLLSLRPPYWLIFGPVHNTTLLRMETRPLTPRRPQRRHQWRRTNDRHEPTLERHQRLRFSPS